MRKIVLCTLLVLFLSFGSAEGLAQEKSYITVEGSNLNNGVVVVDILKAGKTYVLQCNQGAPGCEALKHGKYQMVELPQNFGMYECQVPGRAELERRGVTVKKEPLHNPQLLPIQIVLDILLSDRELESYFVYERTEKEFDIRASAISFEDLARATDSIYFHPRRRQQQPAELAPNNV